MLFLAISRVGKFPAGGLLAYLHLALFEPVCITLLGATPGEALVGTRVVGLSGRPSFRRLTVRYWLKIVLGGLSLALMFFDRDARSLHDRLTHTQVVQIGPRFRPAFAPPESGVATANGSFVALPPVWRRFALFSPWLLLADLVLFLALGIGFELLGASEGNSDHELALEFVLGTTSSILFVSIAKLASRGRLPGARARAAAHHPAA